MIHFHPVAVLGLALLPSVSLATFDATNAVGSKIVRHDRGEICVVANRLAGAKYSQKDSKLEDGLCALSISQNAAVCGKTVSTNPALEFFSVPNGMTAAEVESKNCKKSQTLDIKRRAKYKVSSSCSYTPSILAYYHISRLFGHVAQVPPAVTRTVELDVHKKIGRKTISILPSGELIQQTWKSLVNYLNAGSSSSKRDALMTSDFTFSYGALQVDPKGEEKYREMFFGGANQAARAVRFRDSSPIYKLLKDGRDVDQMVGNDFNAPNLQKLVQMRDVSNLIIMDTILSQEDRFGNVHYTEDYFFVQNDQSGRKVKSENKLTPDEIASKAALKVKVMMLKDNDCGVSRLNHVKDAKMLNSLLHVAPETYSGLINLNQQMANDQIRDFFRSELHFTSADYLKMKKNVGEAANHLQSLCRSGKLKLDLDLDIHFGDQQPATDCL